MNIDLKVFHPYELNGIERMGSQYDGGYVIHKPSLKKVDYLINYGVGYNVGFEEEFAKVTGKPVLAFDPTMKKFKYVVDNLKQGRIYPFAKQVAKLFLWTVKEPGLKRNNIKFIEEGLAASNSEEFKTFKYHVEKHDLSDKKILLKIDIEGAEYEVFNDDAFYEHLDNVLQIIVEFHGLEAHLQNVSEIFHRLSATHSLVHIHANNHGPVFQYGEKIIPDTIEVLFVHNSLLTSKNLSQKSYPIDGLDFPCHKKKKDIPLDFFK